MKAPTFYKIVLCLWLIFTTCVFACVAVRMLGILFFPPGTAWRYAFIALFPIPHLALQIRLPAATVSEPELWQLLLIVPLACLVQATAWALVVLCFCRVRAYLKRL